MSRRSHERHAKHRGWMRVGLALGVPEFRAITCLILQGQAQLLRQGRNGREIWRVHFRDRTFRAVWSPPEQILVTIMVDHPLDGARP